jgi:hypothetical protein
LVKVALAKVELFNIAFVEVSFTEVEFAAVVFVEVVIVGTTFAQVFDTQAINISYLLISLHFGTQVVVISDTINKAINKVPTIILFTNTTTTTTKLMPNTMVAIKKTHSINSSFNPLAVNSITN